MTKRWKKIKNSIDFISLSKASSIPQSPKKISKSKWPKLKHTMSAVTYMIRTLFKGLKLSSVCVFKVEPSEIKPKKKSSRSKWKRVENSLLFINLSKNYVKASNVSTQFEKKNNEKFEENENFIEKAKHPSVQRIEKYCYKIQSQGHHQTQILLSLHNT